jgi:S-adenosylmethionine synthase
MKGVLIMSEQKNIHYRTAESVSPGHPDKICDQISDAVLDAYLAVDRQARVAVEVCGGHGTVFLTGEVTASKYVDVVPIVKRLAGDVEIIEHIVKQSPEIARGVDAGGAGDQGIMVGYATNETPEMIPLETALARNLNQYLYERWPYDGKTQVTLRNGEIDSVVASFQHASHDELERVVKEWIRTQSYVGKVSKKGRSNAPRLHINPAGDWSQGGFEADAGLTGRKLIVDNYGPRIPIGGGAFSGKDATKVDRSAAYMARRIAVDYLRRFCAKEVYVYLAYAIGYDQPLEATAIVDGVEKCVEGYDLSPRGIVKSLKLDKPQFEQTARYGHFGHGFTWDK